MQTQINGITIAYNDRGTGLPIVFLHAFPLNQTMWTQQEEVLSLRFRITTIDLRGHGESDAPLWRYTQEQSAEDVNVLLGQLSIQQAIFVGLSMDGYILFAFYRKYGVRVKGLILADTKAQADTAEGKNRRFQMAQTAYIKGPAAIADIMNPKLLSPATIRTKPALVRQVRAMIEGNRISALPEISWRWPNGQISSHSYARSPAPPQSSSVNLIKQSYRQRQGSWPIRSPTPA